MKRVLYLGIDYPFFFPSGEVWTHFPVIHTVPHFNESVEEAFRQLSRYTHVLFTSKSAVRYFLEGCKRFGFSYNDYAHCKFFAVGKVTAHLARVRLHVTADYPKVETAEGLTDLLKEYSLQDAYFFWPRAKDARHVLLNFFEKQKVRYRSCVLYETHANSPRDLPNLAHFDEVLFTSPSTIEAFVKIFGALPHKDQRRAIGSVTEAALLNAPH